MKHPNNRVLAVGGGSAGHVTPVLAVINELAERNPDIELRFWCDRGFTRQSIALMRHAAAPVKVEKIFAGKIRRYHGASFASKLIDIPTLTRNFLDLFAIASGFFQSLLKLILWRPRVVFCKGGFVCLPVGYAAALLKIPLVIHDSDAHPGLTNRLLARHAGFIATGAPLEYYRYPKNKARYVGIPIAAEFKVQSEAEKKSTKKLFDLPEDKPLLVIIGGGLGAKKINDAIIAIAPQLLRHMSVVHVSGMRQFTSLEGKVPKNANYKLVAFVSEHLAPLLGAADIVITRAGASAMAELAAVGASVIIVPNAHLAGGHQTKNAKIFVNANAALSLDENTFQDNPNLLLHEIVQLLEQPQRRRALSKNLLQFAKPQAAKDTADLIERM